MQTITFYSYKGGTGRSLALANAAIYLARLGFKVVALDFDLEAPGLHYKFSRDENGPLTVSAGVVDYLHRFITEGIVPESLTEFVTTITIPRAEISSLKLVSAGNAPSPGYWSKLARLDWHRLFYSTDGVGVQLFMDLKSRIADELSPDFLLVDSRTGITEMGGIATSVLADRVICLVLPTSENLDGARAVLRSLRRFRRENKLNQIEILTALSRLPSMEDVDDEKKVAENVRVFLCEEAEDLRDTLSCSEIFVLHRESALEITESLRVGSGISPDESILLRDYLRLFATVVPKHLVENRVSGLIELAKEKLWEDPEGAVKEVEELAESFGHPETYRALLRFYQVRNVYGDLPLKKAQRLWEITRDSGDILVWDTLKRTFPVRSVGSLFEQDWNPDLDFVEEVWRNAGRLEAEFGSTLIEVLVGEGKKSRAADICLQIIDNGSASSALVAQAIRLLDEVQRTDEAKELIDKTKQRIPLDSEFINAWAEHALTAGDNDDLQELLTPVVQESLRRSNPYALADIFLRLKMIPELKEIANDLLDTVSKNRRISVSRWTRVGRIFDGLGEREVFDRVLSTRMPARFANDVRNNLDR